MKQIKLTFILTVLMSMVGLQAFSYDAQIDGIYYNFSGTEASVAPNPGYIGGAQPSSNTYTGDVVIPASVTYNNKPYSVTSIGNGAFTICRNLTSVTIPNSVTSIGDNAFYGCSGLTSVTIPNSVTSIGNRAFSGCTGLTSITVESGNTKYDSRNNCNAIIETASNTLVRGCKNTTIPNSVTSIGDYAFDDAELTSVTIPTSVTSIGENAFRSCWGMTSITIPTSVTSIGNNAFNGCSGLTKVIVSDIAAWCGISFSSSNNPLAYAHHLYSDENTEITDLVIPNTVTGIGDYTFNYCSDLSSVTIPNSVTSIGEYAFGGCSGLTSITIPSSVTSIGSSAFPYSRLTSIMVESGNTNYDSRNNCNAIIETANNTLLRGCKNTVIPNGVTSIGGSAFQGCSGLTSVTIPNSVTSIGQEAFSGCSGLTSVTIGNSVTSIDYAAFFGCTGLTSITIPNSVTSIGYEAFRGCSGLTSVTIGNSVTSIGNYAFIDCENLASVTLNSNAIVSQTYNQYSNLKGIFGTQVTEYVIGDDVTRIGNYAFYGCSNLISVTIPNSVTSFGNSAFADCSSLTFVTVDINSPLTITANTFSNRANATLYVPAGCKSAYEAADYWKEFKEIVEMVDPTNIVFADANVKAICVAHWDTNNDGELSTDEAAAVTTLSNYFKNNTSITSFDEFTYFTGVTSIDDYAFKGCSSLTSITIPNSVTSIGDRAFSDCPSLTSMVVESGNPKYDSRNNCNAIIETASNTLVAGCKATIIPNSVTSIGNRAFERCSALTSIDIPYGVTSIGNHAFDDCSDLTSITIPNSITSIGDYAFSDCGLTSVTIPNSVTSIGNRAFEDCPNLTSMVVESGNPNYDSRNDCNAIIETASNTLIAGCKNTIIPNNVASIGSYAFYGCTGLTSITIPNSVTSIGDEAFDGCSDLTSVTALNPTPVAITDYVFTNRTNATLYVPKGSKGAYQAANYWKEFKDIEETTVGPTNIVFADANVKAICVAHWDTNSDGELSYDEAAAVTTISDYFKNNTSITSFDEFAYFTGVTSIGSDAFDGCTGLTSIDIPNGVTSIGNTAFERCSGLTSITIPNSVTSIGNSAFKYCSGLTSVTIPNSVTTINYGTFIGCTSLTSVTIPNSVTSIGRDAFSGCSGLTSVTIPNSVTSIGNYAFKGCSGLTSVTIPNSVTSIGNYAFKGCSGLTSVTIPNSVTSIGSDAFKDCTGLTSIDIPNGVTSIGDRAFSGCSGLTSITIPNSVTSIGQEAFSQCSGLTSITIGNGVTSIGLLAFSGCSSLTSVTVDINTPLTITANTFTNRANATLIVPAGCKSAYEAADYWKEFKEIVYQPEYVTIAMNAGAGKPRSMVGYSSKYGLDFTGITGIRAYIVCGFNFKKEAMLVHVNVVPPYTGIVIKTTNSSYDGEEFVVPTSTDDYYYANLLLPVVESQTIQPTETIDDVEYTNLMVGILNNEQPGFVRLTEPVVRHNKSYLRVPTSLYNSSASARQLGGISMVFEDDEATGISNLNDNVNDNIDANAPRYNIAGQRVGASYKGVVIQNGKKILIK